MMQPCSVVDHFKSDANTNPIPALKQCTDWMDDEHCIITGCDCKHYELTWVWLIVVRAGRGAELKPLRSYGHQGTKLVPYRGWLRGC